MSQKESEEEPGGMIPLPHPELCQGNCLPMLIALLLLHRYVDNITA